LRSIHGQMTENLTFEFLIAGQLQPADTWTRLQGCSGASSQSF
jgi:hypothetical protein